VSPLVFDVGENRRHRDILGPSRGFGHLFGSFDHMSRIQEVGEQVKRFGYRSAGVRAAAPSLGLTQRAGKDAAARAFLTTPLAPPLKVGAPCAIVECQTCQPHVVLDDTFQEFVRKGLEIIAERHRRCRCHADFGHKFPKTRASIHSCARTRKSSRSLTRGPASRRAGRSNAPPAPLPVR
jgi:hypothetical protein